MRRKAASDHVEAAAGGWPSGSGSGSDEGPHAKRVTDPAHSPRRCEDAEEVQCPGVSEPVAADKFERRTPCQAEIGPPGTGTCLPPAIPGPANARLETTLRMAQARRLESATTTNRRWTHAKRQARVNGPASLVTPRSCRRQCSHDAGRAAAPIACIVFTMSNNETNNIGTTEAVVKEH